MRLLVRYGADPNIASMSYGAPRRDNDPSGLAAIPAGARTCRRSMPRAASATAPPASRSSIATCPTAGFRPSGISSRSSASTSTSAGFTALHHAAARGDNAMINYLVSRGVLAVNRAGQTTVDMANSPEQRTQPFHETIALLESLGGNNNHNCRACK